MSKMFKVNDSILRSWLLPKVTHTNYNNVEMMCEYLTAQLGGTVRNATVSDLMWLFLQRAGYSSRGSLGDMLNAFVCVETGIADVSQAYIAFFSSASTSFTIAGGIDTYTKLMLHMDGTNGSTVFTDSEIVPKTATAVGGAVISTAQSVFGGASGSFPGASGSYLTVPDSTDWPTGTSSFTIDFRVRFTDFSTGGAPFFYQQGPTNQSDELKFFMTSDSDVRFYILSGASALLQFQVNVGSLSPSTWYHMAIVRNGTAKANWFVFLNGVAQTITDIAGLYSASIPDFATVIKIGSDQPGSNFLNGNLDEYRISNTARWIANFTPPTSAYS